MTTESSQAGLLVWAVAIAALITGGGSLVEGAASVGRPAPVQRVSSSSLIAPATSTPPAIATLVPAPTTVPTAVPTVPTVARPSPVPTVVRLTPTLAPTPVTSAVVVLNETFADNQRGWPDDPAATAWLAPDGYHLEPRVPGRFVAVSPAQPVALTNLQVTASFHKVSGPPGGGYGLIIRDQAQSREDGLATTGRYYVLEVGDAGEVGIWRRDVDTWVDLIAWMPTGAVHPGTAENELVVRAQGPLLRLLVNGVQAAQVEDATHGAGSVGVFVGGDGNAAVLTRLVIEQLS